MDRWEYKVVKIGGSGELQGLLDSLSLDGWRLAQTYQTMGYITFLIFERPLAKQEGSAHE